MSEDWIEFEEHFIDVIPLTGDRPSEEASLFRVAVLQCGRSIGRFRKHDEAVRVAQMLAHQMDLVEAIIDLAHDCEANGADIDKSELLARITELAKLADTPTKPSNTKDKVPF